MNFSPQSAVFMKPFLDAFGTCVDTNQNKSKKKTFDEIIISLYNEIKEANEDVINQSCLNYEVIEMTADKTNKKSPDTYNGRYFPPNIQRYLADNEKYQLCFTCGNVGNREIKLYFTLFTKDEIARIQDYLTYARMMYTWLRICAKHANSYCAQSLEIFIYPTPFNKKLPNSNLTVLGPEHVNSAYSYSCAPEGQIVIFRKEEWFKVFIHETFHAYGLDKALIHKNELNRTLPQMFRVNSEFNIYEAYTETWARIINCALSSFDSLKNKREKKVFSENMVFCLEMEKMFSIYQCNKILGFMGLEYKDILANANTNATTTTTTKMTKYNENTHVFAYYIITALLLNDFKGFMILCKTQNEKLLRFDEKVTSYTAFSEYIKQVYDCVDLYHGFEQMGKLNIKFNNTKSAKDAKDAKSAKGTTTMLKDTTRMSIIDVYHI